MHSCLAQLTHSETLSAEVIKELEDFLRVPKVKHPMSATCAKGNYLRLSVEGFEKTLALSVAHMLKIDVQLVKVTLRS